jgi:hypothetical protein
MSEQLAFILIEKIPMIASRNERSDSRIETVASRPVEGKSGFTSKRKQQRSRVSRRQALDWRIPIERLPRSVYDGELGT